MNYEIAVKKPGDLIDFERFLDDTKTMLVNAQGLVLVTDDDIGHAIEISGNLKKQEQALTKFKSVLVEMAGITVVDDENNARRQARLDLDNQVKAAKIKIRETAINDFVALALSAIDVSDASQQYISEINPHEIAFEQLKGKSKNFASILEKELEVITNGLKKNAKETQAKETIINKYDNELIRDKEYLLSLPIEALEPELKNRAMELEKTVRDKAQAILDTQKEAKAKIDEALQEVSDLGAKNEAQKEIREDQEGAEDFKIIIQVESIMRCTQEEAKSIASRLNTGAMTLDQFSYQLNVQTVNLSKA